MDQEMVLQAALAYRNGKLLMVTVTAPSKVTCYRSWNASAPKRFAKAQKTAQQATRRATGRFSITASAWEFQDRGLLHKHIVLPFETEDEEAQARFYVGRLKRQASANSFGWTNATMTTPWTPTDAASYLSKDLRGTATHEDAPTRIVHINRELVAQSGVTMRSRRHDRWVYVVGQRYGLSHDEAEQAAEIIRAMQRP